MRLMICCAIVLTALFVSSALTINGKEVAVRSIAKYHYAGTCGQNSLVSGALDREIFDGSGRVLQALNSTLTGTTWTPRFRTESAYGNEGRLEESINYSSGNGVDWVLSNGRMRYTYSQTDRLFVDSILIFTAASDTIDTVVIQRQFDVEGSLVAYDSIYYPDWLRRSTDAFGLQPGGIRRSYLNGQLIVKARLSWNKGLGLLESENIDSLVLPQPDNKEVHWYSGAGNPLADTSYFDSQKRIIRKVTRYSGNTRFDSWSRDDFGNDTLVVMADTNGFLSRSYSETRKSFDGSNRLIGSATTGWTASWDFGDNSWYTVTSSGRNDITYRISALREETVTESQSQPSGTSIKRLIASDAVTGVTLDSARWITLKSGVCTSDSMHWDYEYEYFSTPDELPSAQGESDGYVLSAKPNPFNPSTDICFSITDNRPVALNVYDIRGTKVRTLLQAAVGNGVHHVSFDAKDDAGHALSSGIYLIQMESGGKVMMKRVQLMK